MMCAPLETVSKCSDQSTMNAATVSQHDQGTHKCSAQSATPNSSAPRTASQSAGALSQVTVKEIQVRQLRHCYKADPAYGLGLATRLGIGEAEIK